MDVAIQAKFDATQALKDSDTLFQKLSQCQTVAANIKVSGNLVSQLATIANATSILANAQAQLVQQITATTNAATASASALSKLQQTQQNHAASTNAANTAATQQVGILNSLATRVIGAVGAYLSLRGVMSLVHEAMSDRMAFDRLEIGMRAITQDTMQAAQASQFFQDETQRLGLNMTETIPEFVKMMAALTSSGMSFKDSEKAFSNLSIATKAVGLSSAATGRILYDLQEMASMGSVQMRQLRQMLMQLPGALQAFSQAAGMSTAQFLEQVHKGMIDPMFIATQGLQTLADKYSHEMPEALDTLESHTNRMTNSWKQFMAEMGKSQAIKDAIDLLGKLAEYARGQAELSNLPLGAKNPPKFQHNLDVGAMRGGAIAEANAASGSPEGFASNFTGLFTGTQQFEDLYAKQLAAQKIFASRGKGKTGNPMLDSLPFPAQTDESIPKEPQATEAQMEAAEKIAEIRKRAEADVLTGLEKEKAQIDANAQRQIDAIEKEYQKRKNLPGAKDEEAGANLAILKTADFLKKQAIDKDAAASVQTYLEQIKSDSTDVSNIMRKLIPDDTERKVADIDAEFEKLRDHLQEIGDRNPGMLPKGWDDALDLARHKAEADVKDQNGKTPVAFSGQNFQSLSNQRDQLKTDLLNETDAKQFEKTTNEIQQISKEMALQLHNDAIHINEAFTFGFKEAADQWGSTSERMAKVGETMANSMSSHMTDALTGLIEGTKTAQQAFSEMALGIVQDLIRVAIQELVVKQIIGGISSISGLAGLGGGGGGETNGGTVSLDHAGGVAGMGGASAHVSSFAFAGAPRFHTGGIVGDEVPIVARKGEVVFTPEQMKALSAAIKGGSHAPQKIEIANYTNPQMIDAHLAKNPHLIVNAIMSQRKQIRRVLS